MAVPFDSIEKVYGNRIRVRVCGICIKEDKILLVKHQALSEKGYFLSPPGGGLEFGEEVTACLRREFAEETHLQIVVQDFLFMHEYLHPPLHALELFFRVEALGGDLAPGIEPEMEKNRLIDEVKYMSYEQINQEKGVQLHDVFNHCSSLNELLQLQGYFKFDNKDRY
jgi:8-oxo-dGTP diphosphatase